MLRHSLATLEGRNLLWHIVAPPPPSIPFCMFLPVEQRSYNRDFKISSTIVTPPPPHHPPLKRSPKMQKRSAQVNLPLKFPEKVLHVLVGCLTAGGVAEGWQ